MDKRTEKIYLLSRHANQSVNRRIENLNIYKYYSTIVRFNDVTKA